MVEPSDALRDRARILREQADRLEQMAKELDTMPALSSLPAKAPRRNGAPKRKATGTILDTALGMLKSQKQVTVAEVLKAHGGDDRRVVAKALMRAEKVKRLRKVAPATYALPAPKTGKKK